MEAGSEDGTLLPSHTRRDVRGQDHSGREQGRSKGVLPQCSGLSRLLRVIAVRVEPVDDVGEDFKSKGGSSCQYCNNNHQGYIGDVKPGKWFNCVFYPEHGNAIRTEEETNEPHRDSHKQAAASHVQQVL